MLAPGAPSAGGASALHEMVLQMCGGNFHSEKPPDGRPNEMRAIPLVVALFCWVAYPLQLQLCSPYKVHDNHIFVMVDCASCMCCTQLLCA